MFVRNHCAALVDLVKHQQQQQLYYSDMKSAQS